MKFEDVRIGMKVIPHSKRGKIENLSKSSCFETAIKKNQYYLYVRGFRRINGLFDDFIILSNIDGPENSGDYFISSDFDDYILYLRKEKLKKLKGNEYNNNI